VGASARTAVHAGRLVVHVAGEVDVFTVGRLRGLLAALDDPGAGVVVDLTEATFLDSTGLGVLVDAMKRVNSHGGRMDLVIDDERILKVFRITALNRLFTIHGTLETALADVQGRSTG
jgi:anti-sigma B factor antagonist